jgi:hypothetical protein
MAKSKAVKGAVQMSPPMGISPMDKKRDEEWKTRDDVDTLLKHAELRGDKKRHSRAVGRLHMAARINPRGR